MEKNNIIGDKIIAAEATITTANSYNPIPPTTFSGIKDIPLYEGLRPTNHEYIKEGNHWNDIYNFYLKELPRNGWKVEYKQSAADKNSDVTGFMSRWRKKGIEWELSLYGSYFKMNNQTEVIFDKTPIYHSTTWIEEVPTSICIQQNTSNESCNELNDKAQIEGIVNFINNAIDWEEAVLPREKTSIIDFGDIEMKATKKFTFNQ
ncbi:hypothetical protein GCM10010954_39060 [Halobacillus andaensis]|uniref:Uncharacterized protein n=1 Tax=Halobacillus andaensis TaxID=1176239 RepID=A0A917EZ83_HALAA|nr:hypothetical protein [Halobacillus andaensis]MBP2006737.1 hypothetical protein [Halobacillus andaensis]GGF36248.1 hypothetical protein GCM10010954_39060 [Halobacillus andaensis]